MKGDMAAKKEAEGSANSSRCGGKQRQPKTYMHAQYAQYLLAECGSTLRNKKPSRRMASQKQIVGIATFVQLEFGQFTKGLITIR